MILRGAITNKRQNTALAHHQVDTIGDLPQLVRKIRSKADASTSVV